MKAQICDITDDIVQDKVIFFLKWVNLWLEKS